jgi:hemoglobin
MSSMFERYGGFAKVSRIVSAFYDKVLDSPVVSPYFAHTDMRRLIDHQTRFIASLMDGPVSYSDDHLRRIHARLEIDRAAYLEVMALLEEAFEDFGIAAADIAVLHERLMSKERFIVARP